MTDEIYSKSALFFFLLTLDDKIAIEESTKTIEQIKYQIEQNSKNSALENYNILIMISCCLNQWKILRTKFHKDHIQIITSKALTWPEHLDLNPWKEFQKRAPENELIAVTWVHLLGISESILAKCLNVSVGTIRYRVGKGLSLLGQLNRPNVSSI